MQSHRFSTFLILLALFVAVGGLFLIRRNSGDLPAGETKTEEPRVAAEDTWIMVNDEHTVRVWTLDGEEVEAPLGFERLESYDRFIIGAHFTSGLPVGVRHDGRIDDVYRVLSPDQSRQLQPAEPREDGAGAIEIRNGSDIATHVIRMDSQPVRDVTPVGWWDDGHFAVIGRIGGERHALSVSIGGDVRDVSTIPDEAEHISAQSGALFYVTLTPGPGLESPPVPPSSLSQLSSDGETRTVTTFDDDSILQYLVDGSGEYPHLLQTESGRAYAIDGEGSRSDLGDTDAILLFLDAKRVLIRRDSNLILLDIDTGAETKLGTHTGFDPIVTILENT